MSPRSHSDPKAIEPATFRLGAHCFNQQRKQLQFSVEVALHVLSIFAHVGEQRSFHIPVTFTRTKEYRPMFGGLGGSERLAEQLQENYWW